MSLLELADITLHSGRSSFFKLECDALTADDWRAAAAMLVAVLPPFEYVCGVPRGGLKLEGPLWKHTRQGAGTMVYVDDVWTTGGSMREFVAGNAPKLLHPHRFIGAVLFARGPVDDWVTPLFTLNDRLWTR